MFLLQTYWSVRKDGFVNNSLGRSPSTKRFFKGYLRVLCALRGESNWQAHEIRHSQLNFGGFATAERNIIFDINDFDQVSIALWEWDVKRKEGCEPLGVHILLLDIFGALIIAPCRRS